MTSIRNCARVTVPSVSASELAATPTSTREAVSTAVTTSSTWAVPRGGEVDGDTDPPGAKCPIRVIRITVVRFDQGCRCPLSCAVAQQTPLARGWDDRERGSHRDARHRCAL